MAGDIIARFPSHTPPLRPSPPENKKRSRFYSRFFFYVGISCSQVGTTAVVGGFLLARSLHTKRSRKKLLLHLPQARRSDHTDEYFGHTVEDPYRWLERE